MVIKKYYANLSNWLNRIGKIYVQWRYFQNFISWSNWYTSMVCNEDCCDRNMDVKVNTYGFTNILFDNNLNNLLLYWNNIDLAINFHPVWNNSKNKWNRPISHVLQLVAAMAYLVKAMEWKIYLIEMTLLTPRYNCSNPQCISVLTQVANVSACPNGGLSIWLKSVVITHYVLWVIAFHNSWF